MKAGGGDTASAKNSVSRKASKQKSPSCPQEGAVAKKPSALWTIVLARRPPIALYMDFDLQILNSNASVNWK